MTRPSFRFPLAETLAVVGITFGAWLIHNTFRPFADTPNYALLAVGALDILLCFAWLGYLLRGRLRAAQPLPKSWIVIGVLLIAGLLGWITALFVDSDRAVAEQQLHQEYLAQIAKLETSVRHFSDVITPAPDRGAWQTGHEQYLRLSDQLHASLRAKGAWDAELKRVDEQVKQMHRTFLLLAAETIPDQRLKWRGEYQQARDRAVQTAASLHTALARAERDLAATYRARWHGVGAAALTGVILVVGCLLFWLVFDRELRRSWRSLARLAGEEARFRALVENHAEPIAILDDAANFLYANMAWQTAFGYSVAELHSHNLLALIHEQDRIAVQAALTANHPGATTPCRLSADYGVWHDVEIQCQPLADAGTVQVRIRDLRETSDVPMHPQPELLPDTAEKWQAAEARLAEVESECANLREREVRANQELQQACLLLDSHQLANSDGVLVLSTSGEVLSWNQAFARLWKLSDVTLNGHGWPTIAAHMETQVSSGWAEFQRAAGATASNGNDANWEMALEGGRHLEVRVQAVRAGSAQRADAVQFHFRDVTANKDLHVQLREHEQARKTLENRAREQEKRAKQLEKELKERDHQREEMEETLRDHQDRLHQMHRQHESASASLKVSQDATRRLASGVASDFNSLLSVILGNSEVLRDTLPRDHVAQNYLNDIHDAASKCTDLSQRLIAYSGSHLLQMVPVELANFLEGLDGKLRNELGYNVQLKSEADGKQLWAKLDPHPLEQAILHLANQARQQMPQGGTLTIHASRVQLSRGQLAHADMAPGAYIQIRLSDSGAGLDDNAITHLFEPYHPIAPGQKGDLSLATAQGILRQSGGCIEVASEPGLGTEWTILVPETSDRPSEKTLRVSA